MSNSISLISRIHEKANKFIVRELEKQGISGIVPSHGDILAVLFEFEKCTMKELAQKIHRTKATLTVLVDKLEKLELVTREKTDKDSRITYIRLTKKGQAFKPVFEEISQNLYTKIYTNFSTEEAKSFNALLKKINQNLG